ncbi:MAG TPA: DUF4388 domain-containing protein [Labilithrix sp.]|nr:DUF4388 domain-containing protein [Labilithrix sp.]
MNGPQGEEARRSTRVATSFLVAIDGIDEELVARRGDVSATGIYFETGTRVGDAGSVQFLTIASANRAHEIRLMAHVVRTIALDDVEGGRLYGVAFEFMPESEEAAAAVERFVQHILVADELTNEPTLSPRLHAHAASDTRPDGRAVLRQLSVRSMTLETSWGVTPGEKLRVEIAAPGSARRVRLEGSAVRVTPRGDAKDRPPYEIEVEFQSEIERPPRHASSMTFAAVRPELMTSYAVKPSTKPESVPPSPPLGGEDEVSRVLDDLFAALIHPPADSRPKREHLSGLLTRIRLPTLCALFDMERLSGELTLERDGAKAVIYIRDGQLVDVEGFDDDLSPRVQIARLLAWDEGTFEFVVRPVDRADRVGMSTTALLLDLAREDDEQRASMVDAKELE